MSSQNDNLNFTEFGYYINGSVKLKNDNPDLTWYDVANLFGVFLKELKDKVPFWLKQNKINKDETPLIRVAISYLTDEIPDFLKKLKKTIVNSYDPEKNSKKTFASKCDGLTKGSLRYFICNYSKISDNFIESYIKSVNIEINGNKIESFDDLMKNIVYNRSLTNFNESNNMISW